MATSKTAGKRAATREAASPDGALFRRLLEEAYGRGAWHGPNLRVALRGVSEREAYWRPGPGRHNVCELALHAAYWKYVVRRRLLGERRGGFPLKGSNWFAAAADRTPLPWPDVVDLVGSQHGQLLAAVDAIAAGRARSPLAPKAQLDLIIGATCHDIYHAGQIRLVRKLFDRVTG